MQIQKLSGRTLYIPDIHSPYHHPDALDFIRAVLSVFRPDTVLQGGDITDQHALGRWVSNPDLYSAGHEKEATLEFLEEFYGLFSPHQSKHMLASNHDIRVFKLAERSGIPEAYLRSYEEAIQLPDDWSLHNRYKFPGGVAIHGEAYCGLTGRRMAIRYERKNVVLFHAHSSCGVTYEANDEQLNWAMHCGCLIDFTSRAFDYARLARLKPINALALNVDGVPFVCPMPLDKKLRWTGEVIV